MAKVRLQVDFDAICVFPDVIVDCGGPAFAGGHRDMMTNPSVVVEVLSASTEAWDRTGQFARCVIVSPDAMGGSGSPGRPKGVGPTAGPQDRAAFAPSNA